MSPSRHPRVMDQSSASPRDVVVLLPDAEARLRLSATLRSDRVQFCSSPFELWQRVMARPRPALVLLALRDAAGVSTIPVLRRIRSAFPSLPVVGYCALSATASRDVMEAARAGLAELVFRGFDDVGVALRTAIEGALHREFAARIAAELEPDVPPALRPVVAHCLANARLAPSVESVAAAHGVHRKTLAARLARAGLPPPRAIIGWTRLLVAAHLLEEPGLTVERVALDLEYPSAAAFRNALRRYTGVRPRELRRGGLATVLAAFRRRLRAAGLASDASDTFPSNAPRNG